MSRHIDADDLIKKMREYAEGEDIEGKPIHSMTEMQRVYQCIKMVQEMPTSYDEDYVCRELDLRTFHWLTDEGEKILLEDAKKIVRNGGNFDDD